MELLEGSDKEIITVINKSDLESKISSTHGLINSSTLKLSASKEINELIGKIEMLLDANTHSDDIMLISKRQIDSVSKTLHHIKEAFMPLESGELEFFAYHINEAMDNMSSITRPYEYSQMLDVMFGEFCLGK